MTAPRLLIVDSDREFGRSVAHLLAGAGFEVRVGFDPASGQVEAARSPPQIALVELYLPGSGGPEFVQFLRKHRADQALAVIYLVDGQRVAPTLRRQFGPLDDFVIKPTHSAALLERIHILLNRLSQLPQLVLELGRFASTMPIDQVTRRTRVTVMFTDVRSFTQMAETRDPETVAGALNELFASLAAAVLRYGGNIDKFMGDGMMAVFSSNRLNIGHELAAVSAAREIMRTTASSEVSSLLAGTDFRLGIGLHTGSVVVGPIGPPFARSVTAIGDTVNTAARLCGVARPNEIIISAVTYEPIRGEVEVVDEREVLLKGKRSQQRVYSIASS